MDLISVLIIAIIVLVLLLVFAAAKMVFTINSDKEQMDLTVLWLYPFLKIAVKNQDSKSVLTVYVFNRSIIRSVLKDRDRRGKLNIIRSLKLRDIYIDAGYGFRDPAITGVTCGAINAVSRFINIDSLQHRPDFFAVNDYINLNASAKFSVGTVLINLLKGNNK